MGRQNRDVEGVKLSRGRVVMAIQPFGAQVYWASQFRAQVYPPV